MSLRADLLERCRFPSGGPVDLAVSGGADSLALLVLATEARLQATAHHVDHGLRAGSADEADVVRKAAERYGLSFVSHRVTVIDGPNLEARARSARYSCLPDRVLTGHTSDDQAETVFINLARGAASSGLGGMDPIGKPLLALRRAETHALCAEEGLVAVTDESNADPRFVRNRVRAEVLPLVADVVGRDVVPLLTRQADIMRSEAQYLDRLSDDVDVTDAKALTATDDVLARRAVRNWLRLSLDVEMHPPAFAAVDRVLAVARGDALACDVAGGWAVRRSGQRLKLTHRDD